MDVINAPGVPVRRVGAVIGKVSIEDDAPVIEYTSPWGIDADGVPYYDAAGAVSGEEAILSVDDGALTLGRIE